MIHFTDKQWEKVRGNYRKWWKNQLHRPILPCIFWKRDPQRATSKYPLLSYENVHDFSITPEQIIDRFDYELSCYEFYGDAFPLMSMTQFGPSVISAFLGAELHNSKDTVWFEVPKKIPISELNLEYDESNLWLNRVLSIYRAGMKRWRGDVVMGMTDLSGVLDIIAPFVGTEELLFALYDEPEQVKRVIAQVQKLWLRFFREILDILQGSQGYSDWSSIYHEEPSYMLQCDFSYMISPEMFQDFVVGELNDTASHMTNAFYHLDGIGELPHLDSLLSCKHIKGIQWVPGEGEPLQRDWSEVFSRISEAGKKIQAYYNLDFHLDEILKVIERADDLVKMQFSYSYQDRDAIKRRMREQYGVDE